MKQDHETSRVHLALLGVQLTFGVYPVLARILIRRMSPYTLASIRAIGGALVFLVLYRIWSRRKSGNRFPLGRRDWWLLLWGGVLGIALNQLFYIQGLALTGAMNATWISGSVPVFTLLIATLSGFEKPSRINWLGVLLAFAGCLWLVGIPRGTWRDTYFLGSLSILAGCLIYSTYLVQIRPVLQRLPTMEVVTWTYLFAVPVMLFAGWEYRHEWLTISPAQWGILAFVIAIPTVLSYLLNSWALGRARPSLVASYINVQPVLVGTLAWLWLGEKLTWRLLMSGLLIFAGVYCASRRVHVAPSAVE